MKLSQRTATGFWTELLTFMHTSPFKSSKCPPPIFFWNVCSGSLSRTSWEQSAKAKPKSPKLCGKFLWGETLFFNSAYILFFALHFFCSKIHYIVITLQWNLIRPGQSRGFETLVLTEVRWQKTRRWKCLADYLFLRHLLSDFHNASGWGTMENDTIVPRDVGYAIISKTSCFSATSNWLGTLRSFLQKVHRTW